ncbi:protein WVD2-like 7 [Miscanthus floridulus]|uniref:protein WVD2-like 7 n=1 Tax=Miscanthus floridulus TaxID=154761 RepID=UPI003457887B
MVADVGLRFNGWSYSDLPYNDHNAQDSSVQQMVLDHGSVSFGRFAAESLSWEKRSVFEHNRRQEELSKLTAPGLVAQKKAFFEEYYKRARHLKAQGGLHQTGATMEENDDSTVGHSSQADAASMSEDPVACAPSSTSFEPSTEIGSSNESKCQDAHDLGYLTFNPLFSQTACLPNIQEEERSRSGQKLGSRIVLASLQSEYLKVDPEKSGASKNVPIINRSRKVSKDLPTSVINIPRVDLRRNSENRPSRDLKDPFHKRVETKLRALSDRMDADRTAASTRSASYQPSERAMTSSRSAYQDRPAMSSRSSVCQNTSRALAPSKLAAQASHKYLKVVKGSDAKPHGIYVNKGSSASLVASRNSTATGKSPAKILVVPSSSQVSAKTSRTAQVTLKRSAVPTSVKNKRKHTLVALDEKYPKREYVRRSAPPSARSSSENLPRAAKAPKISNVTNPVSKTEVVQKSRSSSNLVGGRKMLTKRSANCNEENRKVIRSHTGDQAESSMRSNLKGGPSLTKNKPRQERPRWR